MEKAQIARFQDILSKKREELRRGLTKGEEHDAHLQNMTDQANPDY